MFVKRFMKKANLNYREIKKRLALYFMVRALIYSNISMKAFCFSFSSPKSVIIKEMTYFSVLRTIARMS